MVRNGDVAKGDLVSSHFAAMLTADSIQESDAHHKSTF
ncbi:hypothetical protein QG37_08242 [Candidozyma auris]|nr:hypothetical protein QG37_08242 [[Candida] auris]